VFPFLRKKQASCVGLEINADEIRLLHLSHAAGGYTILNHAILPLPPLAIVEGKVKRFDLVQAALQTLVANTGTAGLPAAIALPANSVITKRIPLAACLSEWECEMEIQTNLPRYLPGMTEELYLDFCRLPTANASLHDILLIAARAEEVQTYITLLSDARLHVKIVDVDSYALLRGAALSLDAVSRQSTAVFALWDVGRSMTRFMIFQQADILFMQHWETADAGESLAEVKRLLLRFASMYRQLQIHALIVSADMMDALSGLQEGIGVPLQAANPFRDMRQSVHLLDLQKVAACFQVCCGLAARRFPR
jgi:Tfp pilus assembly PilM family ATPase